MVQNSPLPSVSIEQVRLLAESNGLYLDPERAAALVEVLQAVVRADVAVRALHIEHLPAAGLPWAESEPGDAGA
jgi:hypothetical protein